MTPATPTVTIHYQSPKSDPFKIPKPHRLGLAIESGRRAVPTLVSIEGGEIGPILGLAGFPKKTGRIDFTDPARFVSVDQFLQQVKAAIASGSQTVDLKGWHVAFTDERGPFTYAAKISRVSIDE